MNVYLESSAALHDVLQGEHYEEIRGLLRSADVVTASRLTLAEVGRIFAKLRVQRPEQAAASATRHAQFEADSELWRIHPVDDGIWSRCSRPFPSEPVRTLDAIHLATIEVLAGVLDHLVVLSTDARIRANAQALGFTVAPN